MKHSFFYIERRGEVVNVVDMDFGTKGNFELVSAYLGNKVVPAWRTNVKSAVRFARDKSRDGVLFLFDVEVNGVRTYKLLCSDATSAFLANGQKNASCERRDYVYALYNMPDTFDALNFRDKLSDFREKTIHTESRRAFLSVSRKSGVIGLSTIGISPPGYFEWNGSRGIYVASIKHLEDAIEFTRLSDIQPFRKYVPYAVAEGLCVPPPQVPAELVDRAIRRNERSFEP